MKRSAPLLLVTALVALSACTSDSDPSDGSRSASTEETHVVADINSLPKEESLLFALQADSGALARADSAGEGKYVLTLEHPRGHTTWFTDRPARDGGTISTQDFVSAWADLGFDDVPPNAVMTVAAQDHPLIVELEEPAYDADEGTLSFAVTVIGSERAKNAEGSFGLSSLFIDNASMAGGCGFTGEIDFFPSTVAIEGYVEADGRNVTPQRYPELFEVMGTRFGGGEGYFTMPTVEAPGEGLQALVCAAGLDPADTDPDDERVSGCVMGRVQLFAQEAPVYGHTLADGRELSRTKRSVLFGLLGDRFGGDGETTFALPDLTSRSGTSHQICTSTLNTWRPYDDGAGQCYLSELSFWGSHTTPGNWQSATGIFLPIRTNQALFDLIGTTFGGDGKTTFSLPGLSATKQEPMPAMCRSGTYPRRP